MQCTYLKKAKAGSAKVAFDQFENSSSPLPIPISDSDRASLVNQEFLDVGENMIEEQPYSSSFSNDDFNIFMTA